MKTIAVTGGIGAGKSETVKILARLGASVIDADLLGHVVYTRGTHAYREMIDAFGYSIVGADGEIDRKIVGRMVFQDAAKLEILQSITWPRIRRFVTAELRANLNEQQSATAIEAAVLFEAGWEDLADYVWTVEAEYHLRLARVIEKTGMDEISVRARMAAQLPPKTRIEKADIVIYNDGDFCDLEERITELWKTTT